MHAIQAGPLSGSPRVPTETASAAPTAPPPAGAAAQATTIPAAQPTAAPVAQSTAVPVAQPTTAAPQPTQASAAALSIAVTSLTSPIAKGGNATLSIKTVAGANCGITVHYKSGASTAAGLGPKSADGNGNVSWTWKVGTGTTPGTWRIVVNASANGQNVSQEIPFVVQ